MPISCIPVSLYPDLTSGRMSVDDWIKLGVEAGLDGIDFSPTFIPHDLPSLKELGKRIEDQGLERVMLVGHPDFTQPNHHQWQEEIAQAIHWVKMAAALGCRYLRITAGQAHPQLARQQGIDLAIQGIREVAVAAVDHGVTLAYENHSKSAFWDYQDFSQPHDIYLEILAGCDVPGVGANFDTANPLVINEDPFALLEKVAHRLVAVHINDLKKPGELDPVLIGTGVVPITGLLEELKKIGYNGWLCIEEFSRTGPGAVVQASQWLKDVWHE